VPSATKATASFFPSRHLPRPGRRLESLPKALFLVFCSSASRAFGLINRRIISSKPRGPRGNGLVTLRGLVTRERESFGPIISGSERELGCPFRTPSRLSRNGEVRQLNENAENPCRKGGKRKNAERLTSRRSLSTGVYRKLEPGCVSSPRATLIETMRACRARVFQRSSTERPVLM
jgi:hypothetical protein